MELTRRYSNAMTLAFTMHAGQVRKLGGAPYIAHPLAVSSLVLTYGGDEDEAIAGLLHDVIEDCHPLSASVIDTAFGPRVLGMVHAVTERKGIEDWRARKQAFLDTIPKMDEAALRLKLCDALDNLRGIGAAYSMAGGDVDVLEAFTGGREGTGWYYSAMCRLTFDRMEEIVGLEMELPHPLRSLWAQVQGKVNNVF